MITCVKLDCGIRLVTEKLPEMQAASLGIWVAAGSAYENKKNSGISHYIEHMMFKGTSCRSAREIAGDMDAIGASFNAFTGKEATCYHFKAITEVFPEGTEILLDMFCNSVFDKTEMRRERGVIFEEMNMIQDTPDDYVIDLITEKTMSGTDIASDIIGTKTSLKAITRDDILSYIQKEYTLDSIVIAAAGNFDEDRLICQLNTAFANFSGNREKPGRKAAQPVEGRRFVNKQRDINQTHIALGIPTISIADDGYYAQAVVNDVLGGSMSSMLFQSVREELGLCYSIFSAPQSYTYNGMFFIYAGITPGKEKAALDAVSMQLEKLAKDGVREKDLSIVKQRLKASYIFGLERLDSRMMRIGKNELLLKHIYTEEETMAEIDAVNQDMVNAFAIKIGDIRKYSGASVSRDKLDLKRIIG